jgi:hypothetical protein
MATEAERVSELVSEFAANAMVADGAQPQDLVRSLLDTATAIAMKEDLTDELMDQLDTISEYLDEHYEPG